MSGTPNEAVKFWQQKGFAEFDIPLSLAVSSLNSKDPLIELRPIKQSRWGLFSKQTGEEAVFTHAGIWAWGSDIQTGNFVPVGEIAPEGLLERQLQSKVSWRCDIAYTFDTDQDQSLNTLITALQDFAEKKPSFNRGKRPRRVLTSYSDTRFTFSSKLFSIIDKKKTVEERMALVSYPVHPWIRRALETRGNEHVAPNANLPILNDFCDNNMKSLEASDDPRFRPNDIVWNSFRIAFYIGRKDWAPSLTPLDFVRVGWVVEEEKEEPSIIQSDDEPPPPPASAPTRRLQLGEVKVFDGKDILQDLTTPPVSNAIRTLQLGEVSMFDGTSSQTFGKRLREESMETELPEGSSVVKHDAIENDSVEVEMKGRGKEPEKEKEKKKLRVRR